MTLFPGGTILPREDYDIIVELARGSESAIEFGPGVTTLALVEAGVAHIHTYEYQRAWYTTARRRFRGFTGVRVGLFRNEAVVEVKDAMESYDIAVVDSPIAGKKWRQIRGQEGLARLNTLQCALRHADTVILHDANRAGERRTIDLLETKGYEIELFPTTKGLAVIRC